MAQLSMNAAIWAGILSRSAHRQAVVESGGLTIERERELRRAVRTVWMHGGSVLVESLGLWVRCSRRCVEVSHYRGEGGFAGPVGPFPDCGTAYAETAAKVDRWLDT